ISLSLELLSRIFYALFMGRIPYYWHSSVILCESLALSLPKGKNLSVIAICHSERSEESLCHYMQFSLSS
ncbi:MAG TPA: hypothetical protein PKX79_02580, partial [Spirochaetota bacterium]|nr:hypothetical protein [Spirochaetota bacterium]